MRTAPSADDSSFFFVRILPRTCAFFLRCRCLTLRSLLICCACSIIGAALGVGGTLLALVPYLTRGEVRTLEPNRYSSPCARAACCFQLLHFSHLTSLRRLSAVRVQRKRLIQDRWVEGMYDRDKAIKKQFIR